MKRTAIKRGASNLTAKKPMNKTSAKRRAYRASAAGRDAMAYMAVVKSLPCAVCGAPAPSDAHHVIHDRFGTRKTSDFDVIPLCRKCHLEGPEAIHNGKQIWREKHGPDHGYLPKVRLMVAEIINHED